MISKVKICYELPENSLFLVTLEFFVYNFSKNLNLYVMTKVILMLELMFEVRPATVFCQQSSKALKFFRRLDMSDLFSSRAYGNK